MKHIIIFSFLTIISHSVFAHPGSSTLICKSAQALLPKQNVEVFIKRANGTGWGSPIIEVSVSGVKTVLSTPDDMSNYGETFHNSPLKVIRVTAIVPDGEESNSGIFSVVAMPQSVEAFDREGNPVNWSLKAEDDECYDVSGKSIFKGIIKGQFKKEANETQIDSQILDCTLSYNSGMSC